MTDTWDGTSRKFTAAVAHPDLCNYRWGPTRLHLCDEPVDHPPEVDHRCRCGATEAAAPAGPERYVKVMRAAAQVLQGGPVPNGLGIDPVRDGPAGLGRLLDDHAESVEQLLLADAPDRQGCPVRHLGRRLVWWVAVRVGAWAKRGLEAQ